MILALDTSLTKSGWAVLSVHERKATVVSYGLIKTNAKLSDGERLRELHSGILAILGEYPDIGSVIPIEDGIVRFNTATKQIAKARGVIEFSLADYQLEPINIASVKKWAREVTGVTGKDGMKKENVELAVKKYFGIDELRNNKGGDISDSMAVGIVYLKRKGVID
ncbi:crossover junction endodeoxyribonuclease RuvC [Lysinibacillus xylanilyticus]|uniref:crossover junction endodeoxyribonuclease RuvC n=1 Tax=Lysinibacillus xylanilyticus TaxID=582475 RepID=UPI002284B8A4|nr:crossover junction endodeoxyribonuclease RuvC [Lysinibacillus xylanilyticus]